MKQLKALISKELSHLFNSPIVWIFTAVFLILNNFFYFSNFFLNDQATMRPFFESFPLTLIFFVSLLTMGSVASEKKNGTLEILLSLPLKKSSILLAKFIALLSLLFFTLLFTLVNVFILLKLGHPDFGPIVSSYLGTILLIGLYTSVGLFFSSLWAEQLLALLLTCLVLFGFYLGGTDFILERTPSFLAAFLQILTPVNHYYNFVRGIIYPKDIIYFVSLTVFFLYLAVKKLDFEK